MSFFRCWKYSRDFESKSGGTEERGKQPIEPRFLTKLPRLSFPAVLASDYIVVTDAAANAAASGRFVSWSGGETGAAVVLFLPD